MTDFTEILLPQIQAYNSNIDAAFLHGLLTGFATAPDADMAGLYTELFPEAPLPSTLRDILSDTMDDIGEALWINDYQARFHHGDVGDTRQWLAGYFKAVELNEESWRMTNEEHPKAGAALVVLHSLVDDELHQSLNIKMPAVQELQDDPQLITNLVTSIYQRFHGDLDDSFLSLDEEPLDLLHYSSEELAAMDDEALLQLVTSSDDMLPLEVATACAHRGEAMVALLHQHLTNEENWSADVNDGDWWALLHANFILGAIPGKASAEALLESFRRITYDSNNDLADWLSGYWPALFANKTTHVANAMRNIAEDTTLDWYPRSHAVECVLAAAADSEDENRIEDDLDWLAERCTDESEDPEFRVTSSQYLLDFPRERHRPTLDHLLHVQKQDSWLDDSFRQNDIELAFMEGDAPSWKQFSDPWRFYHPDQIASRQRRWREEDSQYGSADDTDPFYDPAEDYGQLPPAPETYVRDHPKIGRNDPCPCGSGKKYKKCCLKKLH